MMGEELRNRIQGALKNIASAAAGGFAAAAGQLLDVLGYRSDRTVQNQSGEPQDFIDKFGGAQKGATKGTQALRKQSRAIHVLFQLTDEEIKWHVSAQGELMQPGAFEEGNLESFLFAAVDLKGDSYPRGQYAQFTREINKRLAMPAAVLFRTKQKLLTLAFVHRRMHKLDESRDVLGNVSLIREIHSAPPHRAHLDILADLSLQKRLEWMQSNGQSNNFEGLLKAWLVALDTEELNKKFYRELFTWYNLTKATAAFPPALPPQQHVIRLITRILFIWFAKEKGLVAEEWFQPESVKELLKNFDGVGGADYYRAVLQNLFFATLNTKIGQRKFSEQAGSGHRNFSHFRYRSLIKDEKLFRRLTEKTPFINGGLFDCLDSEASTIDGGERIDMFSDPNPKKYPAARRKAWKALHVPDGLFFDRNTGLFPRLNRYKFTVHENTPIEQEVALDPELLGKVFENLLAAYNPETRESARKQTGSYYTPRAVVDYMVDETLVEAIAGKCAPVANAKDAGFWRERLHYLFDFADAFNDADELFEPHERKAVINAIARLKILDPAVGSGAFPMGALHKLTLALRRLDPDNQHWQALQKELAQERTAVALDAQSKTERDAALAEVGDTFARYRGSDFGRKLYLIQNSIFGVDIQAIACQIAKLRFFISLAIEQQRTPDAAANYGIKPLPNLETRFVAADTLLRLPKPAQKEFGYTAEVEQLEADIRKCRELHFHAADRRAKLKQRAADKKLRARLATVLQRGGFQAESADKIAGWNPYDQNAKADWFDAEYMFGVRDGFDAVIGNPPYVTYGELAKYKSRSSAIKRKFPGIRRNAANRFAFFIEAGIQLLGEGGVLSFIVPHSVSRVDGYKYIRDYIDRNAVLWQISDEHGQFENVTLEMVVLFCGKSTEAASIKSVSHREGKEYSMPTDIYSRVGYYPIYYDGLYEKLAAYPAGAVDGNRGKCVFVENPAGQIWQIGGKNVRKYGVLLGFNAIRVECSSSDINLARKEIVITQFGAPLRAVVIDTNQFVPTGGCVVIKHDKTLHRNYVLALLNARAIGYFMDRYILNHAGLTIHLDGHYLRKLPIPKLPAAEQRPFIRLADKILAAKAADPAADTGKLEAKVDALVYRLYSLTPEEIAIVEGQEQ